MKSRFVLILIILLIFAGGTWYWMNFAPSKKSEGEMKNIDMLSQRAGMFNVVSKDVVYFENLKGFFAMPEASGVYPGVVMIHEWWGLNENIKETAKKLAGEGYLVLAVDLYKGEVASSPERARELVSSLNQEEALKNMKAAVSYLRAQKASKVASLGWCFGGGQSLQLALSGEGLDATIIYYGQLTDDPSKLLAVKWPVLGIFGEKDASISTESVKNFETALDALNIKNEIHIYPGVGHAFANPSGANYAPEETKDAWEKTLIFLRNNL